jgi:hypothetical protein
VCVGISLLARWLGNALDRFVSQSPVHEVYTKIISALFIFILYVAMLVFYIEGWWGIPSQGFPEIITKNLNRIILIILSIVVFGMLIHFFVRPLFTQRGEARYWDKLIADRSWSRRENTPVRSVFSPRLRDMIAIASILIIIGLTAYSNFQAGRTYASNLAMFQVVTAESPRPEVVVLRIYGDYLITAPFDRSTKEFEKKLYLLKISEMAKTPLTYERVGPLRVRPE